VPLTGILMIFGLFAMVGLAFYGLFSSSKPNGILATIVAGVTGIVGTVITSVTNTLTIVKLSLNGVLGYGGYLFIAGLVAIGAVWTYNAVWSWQRNRPIRLIR